MKSLLAIFRQGTRDLRLKIQRFDKKKKLLAKEKELQTQYHHLGAKAWEMRFGVSDKGSLADQLAEDQIQINKASTQLESMAKELQQKKEDKIHELEALNHKKFQTVKSEKEAAAAIQIERGKLKEHEKALELLRKQIAALEAGKPLPMAERKEKKAERDDDKKTVVINSPRQPDAEATLRINAPAEEATIVIDGAARKPTAAPQPTQPILPTAHDVEKSKNELLAMYEKKKLLLEKMKPLDDWQRECQHEIVRWSELAAQKEKEYSGQILKMQQQIGAQKSQLHTIKNNQGEHITELGARIFESGKMHEDIKSHWLAAKTAVAEVELIHKEMNLLNMEINALPKNIGARLLVGSGIALAAIVVIIVGVILLSGGGQGQPAVQGNNTGPMTEPTGQTNNNEATANSLQISDPLVFTQYSEPSEKAWTMLIPKGWLVEGGLYYLDAQKSGGYANTLGPKLDLTVKNNAQGSVMLRWLPDMYYCDMRHSPAGKMGAFANGSNYNGMEVWQCLSAKNYLLNKVFARIHSTIDKRTIIESKVMPEVEALYKKSSPRGFQYSAILLTVVYNEDGIPFQEKMFTVIENLGAAGAGMWQNRHTVIARAPSDQAMDWEKIIAMIYQSVKINPKWLEAAIKQTEKRTQSALKTQQYVQHVDADIIAHRQNTMAEISHDSYLTQTGQEDYLNPYTGATEIRPEGWKHHWQDANGNVVVSNRDDYDPNHDPLLKRSDFKQSPLRPRKEK